MGLRQKLGEIEYTYMLDQRELGKIMFIVSTTVFMISLTSLYQTSNAIDDVEQVSNNFSELDAVVNSQQFNNSLSAIQSLDGSYEGTEYQYAAQTFRGMQKGIENTQSAEQKLEKLQEIYRWLTLLSILGATAGLTVIFI